MVVTAADIISDTGSARKTANTPEPLFTNGAIDTEREAHMGFPVNRYGSRYNKGISNMTFLLTAISRDTFAWPKAIKDCWQAIWAPKIMVPNR